jgi:CheY-like chemotaxis protein
MSNNDMERFNQKNTPGLHCKDELELLKSALKEACEANRVKSDFLARMSHEMRTSLNAIIGLSELSLNADGLGEETLSRLEKIYSAGSTLLKIVNDILDISKIEAGKLELVPLEYDLPNLISDTIAQNILLAGGKRIQFTLNIDSELPMRLCGDELRIKQILNNLLSNAFKYTQEGAVELGLRRIRKAGADWLAIWVKDTGIGIKQADKDKLFLDYAQFDTKANRKIEGTGLGLPIAKKLVELMGGSIHVESEYGIGSVFSVKIKQAHIDDETIGEELASGLKSLKFSGARRKKTAEPKLLRLPYTRVLVVDDVPTNLEVAKGMLESYGMIVDCMESGQQAIDSIREEKIKYNAIFMDQIMPEMDGIETVSVIRNKIKTEYAMTVPIIALSANAACGQEAMFLTKGFQAFLSKPVDSASLNEIIKKYVQDTAQEKNYSASLVCQPERKKLFFPWHINEANLQMGYERFECNEQNFLHILRSYSINTRAILEYLKKVSRENLSEYAIRVHGVKGSSFGICANGVGEQAAVLEKAAKAGDFDFIKANNQKFIEMAGSLITNIDNLLSKVA